MKKPYLTQQGPKVDPSDRIYAIGDIHGRRDLLISLMNKVTEDASLVNDGRQVKFVFLGDYIDRGEESRQVLDVLLSMAKMDEANVVFLRGNHEEAMLRFLASPLDGSEWLEFGGRETLGSFGIRTSAIMPGHNELLRIGKELSFALARYQGLLDRMVNWYRSGDVVFCHAGVEHDLPMAQQSRSTLLWGRKAQQTQAPLDGLRVVHGHFDDLEPTSEIGRVCVDTGAYYTGRLTAVRLDNSEKFLSTT